MLKTVLQAYESIRNGMSVITELGVELPKAGDNFLQTLGEVNFNQPTQLIQSIFKHIKQD